MLFFGGMAFATDSMVCTIVHPPPRFSSGVFKFLCILPHSKSVFVVLREGPPTPFRTCLRCAGGSQIQKCHYVFMAGAFLRLQLKVHVWHIPLRTVRCEQSTPHASFLLLLLPTPLPLPSSVMSGLFDVRSVRTGASANSKQGGPRRTSWASPRGQCSQ